jgi:hypothetical protein
MEERHSDNDGSDVFWPGYVDAVTNLVLNLLFLLTVMTVAVFMFALELGRSTQGGPNKTKVVSTKKEAQAASNAVPDPIKENIALKQEIQLLKMKLSQQSPQKIQPGKTEAVVKTVDATSNALSNAPKPLNKLDKTFVSSDTDVLVRFIDEAVAFKPAEHDRLREILKPVVAKEKAIIFVEVPAGFSEAKRMGFYRAMAVRNLLIEMKMPKNSIDVSVKEGNVNANASLVRVKSR